MYLDPDAQLGTGPSFEDCANALLEAGVLLSPSELQGAIAGILAGGFTGDAGEALSALEKTLDETISGGAAEQAALLHASVASDLSCGELDFSPLLPDESFDMAQRVSSLAGWCRAFLGGYAQARVSTESADRPVATDSAEVLRDFAAIAQAAVADDENRSEEDFDALAEYLGVAALRVMADSAAAMESMADARADAALGGTPRAVAKPH